MVFLYDVWTSLTWLELLPKLISPEWMWISLMISILPRKSRGRRRKERMSSLSQRKRLDNFLCCLWLCCGILYFPNLVVVWPIKICRRRSRFLRRRRMIRSLLMHHWSRPLKLFQTWGLTLVLGFPSGPAWNLMNLSSENMLKQFRIALLFPTCYVLFEIYFSSCNLCFMGSDI